MTKNDDLLMINASLADRLIMWKLEIDRMQFIPFAVPAVSGKASSP